MSKSAETIKWTNWVGNQSFTPRAVIDVHSEQDIQKEVVQAASQGYGVRTFGTGHSFTPIVETDGVLLNTRTMSGIQQIDPATHLVTALPKTQIGEFGAPLWEKGLALANQGDIDTQAIAGAVATATHGSGRRLKSFSASLVGAKFVDGLGNLVEISQESNPDEQAAVQTSIGLFGIMTELTIEAIPAYELHLRHVVASFDEMLERFESDLDKYRSFTFFWCPTDRSAELFGFPNVKANHCFYRLFQTPAPDLDRANLPADELVGPAYKVFPVEYEPNFHEMEYFLPLDQAHDILTEMRKLMLRWLPTSIYPMEIRNVAAEEAWMSPHYRRDNLVVSVCGRPGTNYWDYFRAVDSLFAEFKGRPHWGKLHFMTADRLDRLFPRYNDFVTLRQRFDPKGVFLNDHTRSLFG